MTLNTEIQHPIAPATAALNVNDSQTNTQQPLVQFRKVSKVFETGGTKAKKTVTALNNVSLNIEQGDIYGVIGYSGAGKSTLLRTVNGLEKPTSGQVMVNGQDVAKLSGKKLSARQQDIGMIFQQFNLLQSRNVFGNIAYPLRVAGHTKHDIVIRVAEVLEFVGLADKAKFYPEQLSGGQKQRVAIARALANNPSMLISDEATSALDPRTTAEVLCLLKRVNQDMGVTILLITHEMDVIRKICDNVAVMENGEVVEKGAVYDVFSQPQQAITQHFVSSVLEHRPTNNAVELLSQQHHGRLVEVSVEDRESSDPFLSRIAREHLIDFNIVYGGINHLQSKLFGSFTLELLGDPQNIEAALTDLRAIVQVTDIHQHKENTHGRN